MNILLTIALILITIFLLYLLLQHFIYIGIKRISPKSIGSKKVLAVFAHPDDESLSCAGTLAHLSKSADVTLVILTKGERGQEDNLLDMGLKDVRSSEMKESARHIGVTNLIHLDLGDLELMKNSKKVQEVVREIMDENTPDLVITHDPTGLYGHTDHIAVSDVVTELKNDYGYKLWYTVMPKSLVGSSKMSVEDEMAEPNIRIPVWMKSVNRIRSLYVHKSQRRSFTKAVPFKWIPLWVYVVLMGNECFVEV